jgi:hypothetical protein
VVRSRGFVDQYAQWEAKQDAHSNRDVGEANVPPHECNRKQHQQDDAGKYLVEAGEPLCGLADGVAKVLGSSQPWYGPAAASSPSLKK